MLLPNIAALGGGCPRSFVSEYCAIQVLAGTTAKNHSGRQAVLSIMRFAERDGADVAELIGHGLEERCQMEAEWMVIVRSLVDHCSLDLDPLN